MANEIWKDIPGFKGRYQISNYGRVKALARKHLLPTGVKGIIGEKIIKPSIRYHNKEIENSALTLIVTLCKNSSLKNYSVGRLVYNCFIEKFNLNDKSIFIWYKDKNGRNLHATNLEKSLHPSTCIPVTQFDLMGNPMQQFKSVSEASRTTGISSYYIYLGLKGTLYKHSSFLWLRGTHKKRHEPSSFGLERFPRTK